MSVMTEKKEEKTDTEQFNGGSIEVVKEKAQT